MIECGSLMRCLLDAGLFRASKIFCTAAGWQVQRRPGLWKLFSLVSALGLLCLAVMVPAPARAASVPETVRTLCAACHGLDGDSTQPDHPRLAGMDAEYLLRQLKAFASGKRRDETMSAIVANLDPAEFGPLAAYYGGLKPLPGRPVEAAGPLAERGRALFEDGNTDSGVPACAGCHQSDGRGNARFPRLAQQQPAYVHKQLLAYKSGRRATDPLMTAVGQRLTSEEIQALVAYIATLQGK